MPAARTLLRAGLFFMGLTGASFAQVTWTARSTNPQAAVAWSGSRLVATSATGGVSTSLDGVTWTQAALAPTTSNLVSVVWAGPYTGSGPGLFIAVGGTQSTGTILTSPDGVTWTGRSSGTSNYLNSVAWTGSLLVAVGNRGAILTSPDGIVWTSRTPGNSNELFAVTWMGITGGAGQIVAVGDGGAFLTSLDGIIWTSHLLPVSSRRFGITWTGTQLVAVGTGGVVLTATDTTTWTPQFWGGASYLRSVVWSGKQLVAVGNDGTIVSSPDGITWIPQVSGTTGALMAVTWTGTKFVAVGNNGIFTSPEDNSASSLSSTLGLPRLSLRLTGTKLEISFPPSFQGLAAQVEVYAMSGEKVAETKIAALDADVAITLGALKHGVYDLNLKVLHHSIVRAFTF